MERDGHTLSEIKLLTVDHLMAIVRGGLLSPQNTWEPPTGLIERPHDCIQRQLSDNTVALMAELLDSILPVNIHPLMSLDDAVEQVAKPSTQG